MCGRTTLRIINVSREGGGGIGTSLGDCARSDQRARSSCVVEDIVRRASGYPSGGRPTSTALHVPLPLAFGPRPLSAAPSALPRAVWVAMPPVPEGEASGYRS